MHIVIATIRLFLLIIISLLFLIIGLLIWNLSFRNRAVSRFFVQKWARIMLIILNVRVKFTGNKPAHFGILMPNHRSYLDIFIVLAYHPASIVAKKELLKWPVIGQAATMAAIIPVDRNHSGSLIQTMRRISAEVKNGASVILFPEGTTFKGPLSKEFKPGSFKIAFEGQIPIIPAVIQFTNENDAWVGHDLFIPHFYRQMGKWQTKANFWIGESIEGTSVNELMDKTKKSIDTKLTELNFESGI